VPKTAGPISHFGGAPVEQAALFRPIGEDLNSKQTVGDAFLTVQGGEVPRDGLELRHVAFVNVHIIYKGGPLRIENTYFVNCTFDVAYKPAGEIFAAAILSPGPATNVRVDGLKAMMEPLKFLNPYPLWKSD